MSSSPIFETTSQLSIPRADRWSTPWVFGVLILPSGMYVGYLTLRDSKWKACLSPKPSSFICSE